MSGKGLTLVDLVPQHQYRVDAEDCCVEVHFTSTFVEKCEVANFGEGARFLNGVVIAGWACRFVEVPFGRSGGQSGG